MTARRVRQCACGKPVPKDRKRWCSDRCARQAEKARGRERRRAGESSPSREPPVYGAQSGSLVFVPGHPLARKNGWAGFRRVAAFNARGGVCSCDATGQPLEWPAVKVVDDDGVPMLLCGAHTKLRYFGLLLAGGAFAGDTATEILRLLAVLWAMPCPVVGESELAEGERDQQTHPSPLGTYGSTGSVPPVHQGAI